jgi:hypothetical protein
MFSGFSLSGTDSRSFEKVPSTHSADVNLARPSRGRSPRVSKGNARQGHPSAAIQQFAASFLESRIIASLASLTVGLLTHPLQGRERATKYWRRVATPEIGPKFNRR